VKIPAERAEILILSKWWRISIIELSVQFHDWLKECLKECLGTVVCVHSFKIDLELHRFCALS
jgi:hypothetical protein